eukprot:5459104-Amphidinium_carterae.2
MFHDSDCVFVSALFLLAVVARNTALRPKIQMRKRNNYKFLKLSCKVQIFVAQESTKCGHSAEFADQFAASDHVFSSCSLKQQHFLNRAPVATQLTSTYHEHTIHARVLA